MSTMKTRTVIFSVLLLALLSGCVVKSIHPFYKEGDVVYDGSLLGTWTDDDSTRWVISPYTFSKGFMKGDSTDNSYLFELYEDTLDAQRFNVHLFRLDGRMYLDFKPLPGDSQDDFLHMHMIPAHSLALAEKGQDGRWTIGWFNEEWLGKLFNENRVKISHEVVEAGAGEYGDQYILTASTGELQGFIRKYAIPGDAGLCVDEENFLCVTLTKND